ncbi:MAG: hypothetical protein H6740_25450 [Alphaproteobacteria bacterium]|nr:hypothetical protein [Alphaproteobacteria bacterium]
MAVLGLVELTLRLTLPVAARATLPEGMMEAHLDNQTFVYDPDLFWYWKDVPDPTNGLNSHGFRRREPMKQRKPEGVVRAIAFGDSQTLGAGLPDDEAWPHQAERALGPGWEVLNAGVNGYRTLNIHRLLRLRMADYDPDYILVDSMPFDSERDHGGLVASGRASLSARASALLWHSRIYYALRLTLEKLNPRRPRWLDRAPGMLEPFSEGLGNHDLIADWAEDHGAQAVFLTYAVNDEGWKLGCHTRPGELPEGVPIADVCAAFRQSGHNAHALFQDRNHFTALGAEVAGQAVADTLRALEAER